MFEVFAIRFLTNSFDPEQHIDDTEMNPTRSIMFGQTQSFLMLFQQRQENVDLIIIATDRLNKRFQNGG